MLLGHGLLGLWAFCLPLFVTGPNGGFVSACGGPVEMGWSQWGFRLTGGLVRENIEFN